MLTRLRDFALTLTRSKRGLFGIGVASFLESIIVPVPFEALMVPVMLADRQRIWVIATVTTLGCLVGAFVGYAVGYFLFESVGTWFIQEMGYAEQFETVRQRLIEERAWLILTIGIVPIPSQIAMPIARGIRYYGLAALVWYFGGSAKDLLMRNRRGAQIVGWSLALLALAYGIVHFSS